MQRVRRPLAHLWWVLTHPKETLARIRAEGLTFRARLILAATVAVVCAVVVASGGAYVASRNALVNSVDATLQSTANQVHSRQGLDLNDIPGLSQIVAPDGNPLVPGVLPGKAVLAVTTAVKAVANGQASPFFTNTTVSTASGPAPFREYVTYVPPGTSIDGETFASGFALQLAVSLTGVDAELGHLGLALVLVALAGVVLALILGALLATAAIAPIGELTAAVENIAATTDVSRRLDPGGVDELGRLRRAFNDLLAALEASREAQRQLVEDASHELRTPLTSLRTNLEVVRRVDELAPNDREVLVGDVLTQMEELTTLVGDLAELARGNHREEQVAPLRLDQLVEDEVTLAASHGRLRGVTFRTALRPTWVRGDRERIARAVGNLLDNAAKWSPEGGVVEVWCADGEVVVRDHGPGIAPEDLPHVFDRFYRAASARGLPGSGLGLAIVAQVADEEGGSVSAGAAPGGGAVLRLRLPAIPAPVTTPDQ